MGCSPILRPTPNPPGGEGSSSGPRETRHSDYGRVDSEELIRVLLMGHTWTRAPCSGPHARGSGGSGLQPGASLALATSWSLQQLHGALACYPDGLPVALGPLPTRAVGGGWRLRGWGEGTKGPNRETRICLTTEPLVNRERKLGPREGRTCSVTEVLGRWFLDGTSLSVLLVVSISGNIEIHATDYLAIQRSGGQVDLRVL